jgi:glycosyltransferase involved in cell wall biosynthesis
MRVTVVTATLGESTLTAAAASVQEQTWPEVTHLVIADGPDAADGTRRALDQVPVDAVPRHVIFLPYRTGGPVTWGHKAYLAAAYLAPPDTDVLCMLDADNWYEPEHVADVVAALAEPGVTWAYALRNIVGPEGQFLCRDDCDSIGEWQRGIVAYVGTGMLTQEEDDFYREHAYHVDVNCCALPVGLLRQVGDELLTGRRSDSAMACRLIAEHPGRGTGRYTVNYRLGSSIAGTERYYRDGNETMLSRYPEGFPWARSA